MALSLRTRMAARAGQAVAAVSRRAHAGEGSVIGGIVLLRIDPRALERYAAGHTVCLVSGTNGKTTTTRLLASALETRGPVTTNSTGANLLSGLVSTLAEGPGGGAAVLEVDEALLPSAVTRLHPALVVLLNLSRDQLDRIAETRHHAQAWRDALDASPSTAVAANADDPLVVWAAESAELVTWVETGQRWRLDAYACPACGGRIDWTEDGDWACSLCALRRPRPHIRLDGNEVVLDDGRRVTLDLRLPGWPNQANAAMAAAGAAAVGVDAADALQAMTAVSHIAGRYQVVDVNGATVRFLLAKNPAGWAEALDIIRPAVPLVVGINARVADGRDPSWLYDVEFEQLRERFVVATGERGRDLAVRLRYADVDHAYVPGYLDAVHAAAASAGPTTEPVPIDLAANYTSFQDARLQLARAAE